MMKFGTDQLDSKLKRFPPGGNSDFQFLLVWGLDIDLTQGVQLRCKNEIFD